MPRVTDEVCYVCLFVLGILTRFVMLNHPRQVCGTAPAHARSPPHRTERLAELQVVFDEYHFGKFVNGYITGEYFFDIHPPLGKLLLCLVAWMGGYDGSQSWDKIGVDIPPEVNLLALRGAPALQGALLVPLMFGTARALGISTPGALLGACGVLLDGCFLVESRFVLTDATLLLCIVLQVWGCASAAKHPPLSGAWLRRTVVGGLGVAGALCTKWTGVSALAMAGLQTLVLLLRGLASAWRAGARGAAVGAMLRHGLASAALLLLLPALLYLGKGQG